jgi:hypothetical protein
VNGTLTGGSTDGLTGLINDTVTVNSAGSVNPGFAVDGSNTGILTTSTFLANSSATLNIRIDNTAAGTGHDQVRTSNAIDLNNDAGTGALLALNVAGYSYNFGDVFFIIVNSGVGDVKRGGYHFCQRE